MAAEGGNRKAGNAAVPACRHQPASLSMVSASLTSSSVRPPASWVDKRHFDIFVDVEPFGMVIELFRHQRGTRHEAEGLIEIGKDELFGDGVATVDLGPAFEPGERSFARFAGELLRHLENSICAVIAADPARQFLARSRPAKHHHVGNTASRGEVPGGGPASGLDSAEISAKFRSQGGSRLRWRHPRGINQSGDLADEPGLALWRQNIRHVVGLTMPPGLPHQPLAMRLWLSRRSDRADGPIQRAAHRVGA